MRKDAATLEARLKEWVEKVIKTQGAAGVNTYRMLVDVDKILAEEFDHEPVLSENK